MKQKLEHVQMALREKKIDGWLLYDFRRSNDLACKFLEIPLDQLLSRRFFYWIPSQGEPVKIVSSIEDPLKHLPGHSLKFHSWQELEEILYKILKGSHLVAMEYSPRNAVPTASKVDGGTIELIRSYGVEVLSSSDLLQKFNNVLSLDQMEMHLEASKIVEQIVENTWEMIFKALKQSKTIDEYEVQQFILKEFVVNHCISSDSPICAINANSANPHYIPQKVDAQTIKPNDFILLDLWCKLDRPQAIYADITRVGVAAPKPTERHQEVFLVVQKAQEAATNLVIERFKKQLPIQGWEVDQAARKIVEEAGFGKYFIHRTGHSIDTSDHGSGANIDNLETQDLRFLLPGTCFSIEPGIYLPGEFGLRLEYDILIGLDGVVQVTGGVQKALKTLS